MAIDRSASKTAEDIIKATALFGIYSFIADRANLHYQCSEDVNLFAVLGAVVVAVAFFGWAPVSSSNGLKIYIRGSFSEAQTRVGDQGSA